MIGTHRKRAGALLLSLLPVCAALAAGCPPPRPTKVRASVESYDPVARAWQRHAKLPEPRTVETSILASNGLAYVFGGSASKDLRARMVRADAYDPATGTWTQKHDMPAARAFASAHEVGGLIYLVGGVELPPGAKFSQSTRRVDAYDPVADTWATVAPVPAASADFASAVADGRLVILGGVDPNSGQPTGEVFEYDPVNDVWIVRPSMPTPRFDFIAVSDGDVIYAIGGGPAVSFEGLDDVEIYDPAGQSWSIGAPVPERVFDWLKGVALGPGPGADILLVPFFLGENDSDEQREVFRYDPVADAWSTPPLLPQKRVRPGIAFALGRVYVLGGHGVREDDAGNLIEDYKHGSRKTVVSYDPATDTWRDEAPMKSGRELPFAFEALGRLYVVGGLLVPD